jgi:uncharacterized protein YecE (DUF72 family)
MTMKVGCSGFQEARSKYYDEFSLVEIQQTFFQPPPIGTVLKWKHQAPANFEFTIKAWQLITHEPVMNTYQNLQEKLTARDLAACGLFKPTRMVFEAWNRTEAVANALNAKIIVFQGGRNFRPTPDNLQNFRNFFKRIRRGKFQLVWEPNGRWPDELIKSLCADLNLIYTAAPLSENQLNFGPLHYYRLRGKNGFHSRYNESDFAQFKKAGENGVPSYFIFNNASMLFDARNFVNSLNKLETDIVEPEPLPVESVPEPVAITEVLSDENPAEIL